MKKESSSENFGILSVVLGVISITLPIALFPFTLLSFVSVAGLVLSIIALVFALKSNNLRKPAVALAIIGLIVNILFGIWMIAFIGFISDQMTQFAEQAALQGVGLPA